MIIIRISLLLISACILALGLLTYNGPLATIGAYIFLLYKSIYLFEAYKEAKLFRSGQYQIDETQNIADIFEFCLSQGLVLTGLALTVIGHPPGILSGIIIWGGTLVCYFISGLVAREVAGIDLEMGYGGWHKRNIRKRYRK